MSDAVKMLYESVRDRLNIGFYDFELALRDWEIVPLTEQKKTIGAIMRKGNELHIGYGVKPRASIRRHIRPVLQKAIKDYGCAVTTVEHGNETGEEFCKRIGFVEIGRDDQRIFLKCEGSKYVSR